MNSDAGSLRARILASYVSVHAFCRAHPELKRATVYMVLAGTYPGRIDTQVAKIRAALSGAVPESNTAAPMPRVTGEDLTAGLQEIRCAHCRRLDRRECAACRAQTEREGKELFSRLF